MSRVVVLGSCGAWPEAGRACSGFLVEHAGFRVVLDLGYGTLPRLLSALGSTVADGLDAVVVTHQHADHMVDLHGLFRARWFGRRGAAPLPLYAPLGVVDVLTAMDADVAEVLPRVFDVHPLPAAPYEVGPFQLTSRDLPHFVPNAGVRLASPEVTVAYTGDSGPDPAIAELARDADLFIAEASGREQQPGVPRPGAEPRLHLNARDAGEAAAAAGVSRLLLMHFWPGNDRAVTRRLAEEVYAGEVLVAEEGMEVPLP
jgi:ribonuclease BN (tRNA processing enzyme)